MKKNQKTKEISLTLSERELAEEKEDLIDYQIRVLHRSKEKAEKTAENFIRGIRKANEELVRQP